MAALPTGLKQSRMCWEGHSLIAVTVKDHVAGVPMETQSQSRDTLGNRSRLSRLQGVGWGGWDGKELPLLIRPLISAFCILNSHLLSTHTGCILGCAALYTHSGSFCVCCSEPPSFPTWRGPAGPPHKGQHSGPMSASCCVRIRPEKAVCSTPCGHLLYTCSCGKERQNQQSDWYQNTSFLHLYCQPSSYPASFLHEALPNGLGVSELCPAPSCN